MQVGRSGPLARRPPARSRMGYSSIALDAGRDRMRIGKGRGSCARFRGREDRSTEERRFDHQPWEVPGPAAPGPTPTRTLPRMSINKWPAARKRRAKRLLVGDVVLG